MAASTTLRDYSDRAWATVFAASPLSARLPSVKAKKVLQLPGGIYNGACYDAARELLRQLEDALA